MLWHQVLVARYGGLEVGSGEGIRNGSSWWRSVTRLDAGGHGYTEHWMQNNLVRKLGDGKEVRFWLDRWVGDGSLGSQFPRVFSLAAEKESLVNDMGEWVGEEWRWQWQWRWRELHQWEEDLVIALAGVLQGTSIRQIDPDGWCWKADDSGLYSVKSVYGRIMNNSAEIRDHFFTLLWSNLVPTKVAALGWRATRNRLQTKTNLATRGVQLGENGLLCAGCGQCNETVQHLFFECSVFSELWGRCLHWCGLQTALQADCKRQFQQFRGLFFGNNEASNQWQVIWLATLWTIWLNRNDIVFNNKRATADAMFEQTQVRSWTWLHANGKDFVYPQHNWIDSPLQCLDADGAHFVPVI